MLSQHVTAHPLMGALGPGGGLPEHMCRHRMGSCNLQMVPRAASLKSVKLMHLATRNDDQGPAQPSCLWAEARQ